PWRLARSIRHGSLASQNSDAVGQRIFASADMCRSTHVKFRNREYAEGTDTNDVDLNTGPKRAGGCSHGWSDEAALPRRRGTRGRRRKTLFLKIAPGGAKGVG